MYSTADNTICNNKPGLITFYSLICANGTSGNGYDYKEYCDANGDGTWKDAINTEHIWPQSYFDEKYPMRSDLHHLRPTFTKPNSMRSNYSFAEVPDWDYSTSAGSKRGYNKFEPSDAVKGDVGPLSAKYSPLDSSQATSIPAKNINCFNLEGIGFRGQPLTKTVTVPRGRVQAMWFGIDVPAKAKQGS